MGGEKLTKQTANKLKSSTSIVRAYPVKHESCWLSSFGLVGTKEVFLTWVDTNSLPDQLHGGVFDPIGLFQGTASKVDAY